ncbi:MAG: energy transducer TonB [Deltaproteobacteria bacterium]|jgi:protein TonB|nr:energy transducer TonB [Deltaproteobacteria bacterium]
MESVFLKFCRLAFWRSVFLAFVFHLTVVLFIVLPGRASDKVEVLGSVEFDVYDPLGGEPGVAEPEILETAAPNPDPEPEPEPEPEIPEEVPELLETKADEAEATPPLPPPVEKPKIKVPKKPKPNPAPAASAAGEPSQALTKQTGEGQGGVGGGTGRGNPDARRAYMARIQRLLERNKKYPPVARSNRFQGVVYVRFTLNREGRVVGSQITKSSGQVVLDDEVMGLVNRVNPFPTFPKEMEDSALTLNVPIQFRLR